jgi:hypothetical protein
MPGGSSDNGTFTHNGSKLALVMFPSHPVFPPTHLSAPLYSAAPCISCPIPPTAPRAVNPTGAFAVSRSLLRQRSLCINVRPGAE